MDRYFYHACKTTFPQLIDSDNCASSLMYQFSQNFDRCRHTMTTDVSDMTVTRWSVVSQSVCLNVLQTRNWKQPFHYWNWSAFLIFIYVHTSDDLIIYRIATMKFCTCSDDLQRSWNTVVEYTCLTWCFLTLPRTQNFVFTLRLAVGTVKVKFVVAVTSYGCVKCVIMYHSSF